MKTKTIKKEVGEYVEFIEWLVGGGIIAVLTVLIAYLNYQNKIKKEIAKEAKEKAEMNQLLKNIQTKLEDITKKYDDGISDYYTVRSDLKIVQNTVSNLIHRYNREHDSLDLKTIRERKRDEHE